MSNPQPKSVGQKLLADPTVHFNLWVPVVYAILGAVGVAVPIALPIVLTTGNALLRLFTSQPIVAKPKPAEVKE